MSEQVKPLQPTLRLQINTTGAWRNVIDFESFHSRKVEQGAEYLFGHDERVTLRIIVPGESPPVKHWSQKTGWRVWGDCHAHQT